MLSKGGRTYFLLSFIYLFILFSCRVFFTAILELRNILLIFYLFNKQLFTLLFIDFVLILILFTSFFTSSLQHFPFLLPQQFFLSCYEFDLSRIRFTVRRNAQVHLVKEKFRYRSSELITINYHCLRNQSLFPLFCSFLSLHSSIHFGIQLLTHGIQFLNWIGKSGYSRVAAFQLRVYCFLYLFPV